MLAWNLLDNVWLEPELITNRLDLGTACSFDSLDRAAKRSFGVGILGDASPVSTTADSASSKGNSPQDRLDVYNSYVLHG